MGCYYSAYDDQVKAIEEAEKEKETWLEWGKLKSGLVLNASLTGAGGAIGHGICGPIGAFAGSKAGSLLGQEASSKIKKATRKKTG